MSGDSGEPSLSKVIAEFQVRPFQAADAPQLLELMQDLAAFEGYGGQFAVTARELVVHGLVGARFGAFVAAEPGHRLLGMAVHYRIPWTYDLKPTLVMKELFVAERARGRGVGRALMAAVVGGSPAHRGPAPEVDCPAGKRRCETVLFGARRASRNRVGAVDIGARWSGR
jgi:GNAT superfamily N-acetyltransferase